jgi:hypothetical protein
MATQTTVRIKNLKTEKVYPVSAEEWANMRAKGYGKKFEVVGEHTIATDPKAKNSFIPDEIQEAAREGNVERTKSGRNSGK